MSDEPKLDKTAQGDEKRASDAEEALAIHKGHHPRGG